MNAKQFLQESSCKHSARFSVIQPESERHFLLSNFLRKFASACSSYTENSNGEFTARTISLLKEHVTAMFEQVLDSYEEKWFGQSWKMAERQAQDQHLFSRFCDWFFSHVLETRLHESNVSTHLIYGDENDATSLEDFSHLIIEKNGSYQAICLSFGKAKLGMKGRSVATKLDAYLPFIVNKCSLETKYPNITIVPVYIGSGVEKGEILSWQITESKSSNVFFLPYTDCYEDGNFLSSVAIAKGHAYILSLKPSCNMCSYSHYCKMQPSSRKRPAVTSSKVTAIPEKFSEEQQQIVEFEKGVLLCCAGPGSGKTASLTGRVHSMVSKGYYSELMLLISFTEKAAGELRNRISSFIASDEMPKICTLNSLGFEIIREVDKLTSGKQTKLLTVGREKRIVSNLLNSLDEQLKGINYEQFQGSPFATVPTVARYLKEYANDPDGFFEKHPAIDITQWVEFYNLYHSALAMEQYITYDEQITRAVAILKNPQYSNILKYFHAKYHYIMVDEFQDVNSAQNELIYLLAKGHGNLVCIGDDDQSIYSWRGGSSYFMEHFHDFYPDARIVKLQENYRSTKNIVRLCNDILQGSDCERIDKQMVITNNMQEGVKPFLAFDNSAETLHQMIEDMLQRGYQYSDIGIIATKNEPLVKLNETLPYPSTLASAYLRNDFLFNVCYYTLDIVLGMSSNFNSYASLGFLFDMPPSWFSEASLAVSLKETLSDCVFDTIAYASSLMSLDAKRFVSRMAVYLDMDDSVSESEMNQYFEQAGLTALLELYYYMNDMIEFEDEKKLEYPADGNITLITSHSAKGKEYPCTILCDTDAYKGHTAKTMQDDSSDRRLLYVAASRARRLLYMLRQPGSSTLLDECPHVQYFERGVS